MVKKYRFLSLVFLSVFFAGCASAPPEPIDRGIFNVENVSEDKLAVLILSGYITVGEVDGHSVEWIAESYNQYETQTVKIAEGVHSFDVFYDNGITYTHVPVRLIAYLEAGNEYLLDSIQNGNKIQFLLTNQKDGSDATLNFQKLRGEDPGTISQYIKYVLNPTMDGNDKTVKLENKDYILIFKPDMIYEMTNKKTGESTIGRRGFITDILMKEGKTYLMEVNPEEISREDFLDIKDTEEFSQFVLEPCACTENSVSYVIHKPEELKGQKMIFMIVKE